MTSIILDSIMLNVFPLRVGKGKDIGHHFYSIVLEVLPNEARYGKNQKEGKKSN